MNKTRNVRITRRGNFPKIKEIYHLCVDDSCSCILSENAFCKGILLVRRNLKSGSIFIPLMEASKIGLDFRLVPPTF